MTEPDYKLAEQYDKEQQAKKKKVKCLGGCGKKFTSKDPKNVRICCNCKSRNRELGKYAGGIQFGFK